MAKLTKTASEIRAMSDAEWNEYRKQKWEDKRKYHSEEMPQYYLANKERYANFLENVEKKRGVKLHITSADIRKMNEEQWNEYRQNSWLKQRKRYEGEMDPYFLRSKEKYADFLAKIEKKINKK